MYEYLNLNRQKVNYEEISEYSEKYKGVDTNDYPRSEQPWMKDSYTITHSRYAALALCHRIERLLKLEGYKVGRCSKTIPRRP